MTNAFADGARQLVVRPTARASFLVGRDVGRVDLAGQIRKGKGRLPAAFGSGNEGSVVLGPVSLAVAGEAVENIFASDTCRVPGVPA